MIIRAPFISQYWSIFTQFLFFFQTVNGFYAFDSRLSFKYCEMWTKYHLKMARYEYVDRITVVNISYCAASKSKNAAQSERQME